MKRSLVALLVVVVMFGFISFATAEGQEATAGVEAVGDEARAEADASDEAAKARQAKFREDYYKTESAESEEEGKDGGSILGELFTLVALGGGGYWIYKTRQGESEPPGEDSQPNV